MCSEETDKSLLNLCNSFMFRKCFFDFFQKMQLEGIEVARKFWDSYPCKNVFPSNASDMFERMVDFYTNLNLVPRKQYDKLLKEHGELLFVNTFLRETFSQLTLKIYVESGERLREAWNGAIDRQIEMNKEIARKFFEYFDQSGSFLNEKEMEKSLNTTGSRQEIRHKCDIPVEFVLNNGAKKTVKGVILNFSDSGLCINSAIALNMGQKIIIKGSIPTQHEAFTVRWSNALVAGLSADSGN